ncbi:THC0290_0291 family protein [Flavobacterium laiguense]|uniref:Glutamate dehydrogenase n=1 Tax=Flavobacterium laiguense TaxID=2169409 RepID=A0A2U1K1P2_9FLAO|nr:glutamate dehydrogenase [Flavobacterium laiguense]PWA11440.1 glutamate dehydrogenase [Flavobacterium laiguense]
MINPKTIISVLLIGLSSSAFSQSGISHEIGVIAGPLEFRSDYGERNNQRTNTRNVGYAFGIIDYLTFSYRNNLNPYFSEHFRVRAELSYSKTDLHHYGKWVDNDRNTLGVRQLRAMYGSTQLINFGPQLEFSPLNIHRFERSNHAFGPYIGVGAQVSYYTATAGTTMGELGNPLTTFAKYLVPSDGHPHGYSNESKIVFSGIINLGTRYKLNPLSDLLLNVQAQYFNSDWVDGLNPNKDTFKENKDYDSTVWIALGYIYYLDD